MRWKLIIQLDPIFLVLSMIYVTFEHLRRKENLPAEKMKYGKYWRRTTNRPSTVRSTHYLQRQREKVTFLIKEMK